MKRLRTNLVATLIALTAAPTWAIAASAQKPDAPTPLPPGYGPLAFTAPAPESYELPALFPAADGEVVDETGAPLALHSLLGDKIVLLSFIYATCSDISGCPLATTVLHQVKRRLAKEPTLAQQLRLITLSFDPEHDTPAAMRHYGAGFSGSGAEWRFLTTRSEKALRPILEAYNQTVQKQFDEAGRFTGTFSHTLRVYLIDRQKKVRNIYSVSFLHPDTLINDIKSLVLTAKNSDAGGDNVPRRPTLGPGDDKRGYAASEYHTDSLALTQRRGKPANLLSFARKPPLGLPPVPVPEENPLTEEKIALGRKLFYDRRISLNGTQSCAMCHIPEQGFTNNELTTAVGIEGRSVRRNTPTIYNVAYATRLFHDGREFTLEQQVWGPLLAKNEMANPSVGHVIEKLRSLRDYAGLFESAFGRGPSMETIGMALASYQRTLNAADSPFDRWRFGGEETALSQNAKRGYKLFQGKAGCATCHQIGPGSALLTDNAMHNTGIGYRESMQKEPEQREVTIAPGVTITVDTENIADVRAPRENDLGYYEITENPEDRWKYKTPSLRNVALTAPYMHNGSLATLREVVEFYNSGGVPNESLDPAIAPLQLDDKEVSDLIAFLRSLTGSNVDEIVADAFAAPVGDPQ